MGRAGKRQEMVEDRCVQETHIEVRSAKEFRVKVLLVKGVCAKVCKAISATPATQSEGQCHQVPPVPRKVKVDVTKRHASHAKSCGARQTQARHQSQPRAISATSAMQNARRCRQVPLVFGKYVKT